MLDIAQPANVPAAPAAELTNVPGTVFEPGITSFSLLAAVSGCTCLIK